MVLFIAVLFCVPSSTEWQQHTILWAEMSRTTPEAVGMYHSFKWELNEEWNGFVYKLQA